MRLVYTSYEDFSCETEKWPRFFRRLIIGRRHDFSEIEYTPERFKSFKSTSICDRLYRSLPGISTIAGIIRLIEANAGPVHPKDRNSYKIEVLCGVVELLGLGILLLVIDILRSVLALTLFTVSSLTYTIAKKCPCIPYRTSQSAMDFAQNLEEFSDYIV